MHAATQNMSMTACGISARNRGPHVSLFISILFAIAFAAVLVRVIYKLLLERVDIGSDDCCVVAASLTLLSSTVVTLCGLVRYGLGQDIWVLDPDTVTTFFKYVYVGGILYFCETALLKFSFLFFYIRVFTIPAAARVLWITIASVAVWAAVFQLLVVFRCHPITFNWENWDGLHHGRCIGGISFAIWHGGINISIDVWMLAIPMWQVWGLNMHWKKKVRVAVMFILGTLVTVVSILRMRSMVHVTVSDNPTWELYDVFFWSKLEISVGIFWQVNLPPMRRWAWIDSFPDSRSACLPTLRKFVLYFVPSPKGPVVGNHGYYFDQEGNNQRQKLNQKQPSLGTTGMTGSTMYNSRSEFKEEEDQTGIMMETLAPDQRSNGQGDEISLASHGLAENRPQSHKSVV